MLFIFPHLLSTCAFHGKPHYPNFATTGIFLPRADGCTLCLIVQYLFPTIRAGDARWKSVKKASSPPTASCDQIVCNSSSSRLFRPVIVHCPTPSHHHLYHPRIAQPIVVTTGIKPRSKLPVHLCQLYTVGSSELGSYIWNLYPRTIIAAHIRLIL